MKPFFTNTLMQTKTKPCCIIQTSPMHTASTFLTNVLYGLINELYNKPVKESGNYADKYKIQSKILVVKCHHIDIDYLNSYYGQFYDLYFVCSERREKNLLIDPKYKKYHNVLVFDFVELNETPSLSLESIVKHVAAKVKAMVPGPWGWSETKAIRRIRDMNQRYAEIKERPFTYQDPFFLIHGHHRNRGVEECPTDMQTHTTDMSNNPICNSGDSVLYTQTHEDASLESHAIPILDEIGHPLQDVFVEMEASKDTSLLV